MRTGLRALLAVPLMVGLAAAPAHADWRGGHGGYGGYRGGWHGHFGPGPVVAGVLGLGVLGAAVAGAFAPPPVVYAPPPAYYPPPPYYYAPPPPRAYAYPYPGY